MVHEERGIRTGTGLRGRRARAAHPRAAPGGTCDRGVLAIDGSALPLGVAWLDETGEVECAARWSRATGIKRGPDIDGLALRLEGVAAGDLLVASTGTGPVRRFVLALRRAGRPGPMTTLLPFRGPRGALLLRLDPRTVTSDGPPTEFDLLSAPLRGRWTHRGTLRVEWTDRDCTRRHDPVGHPPIGLGFEPWREVVRDPAYKASQKVSALPDHAPR